MRCAYLYMVHVVLQYATDVKNMIIKNLRLRFWEKIRMRSLCTENSVDHTQSYIVIPVWPEIRHSQHLSRTVLRVCTQFYYV